MANVLNSIIANQSIKPKNQEQPVSYTYNSEGRVKPMKDRGRLLPSKIFASPIEYAKDFGKDVVSIGKAAKGKANDHELGRINDLAMKAGSIALATYLFVKNPFKLSKAMEFIGAGTFFAGMALWPKLAIQAPLKARTGVDIHQKYVDSQGRKKMLYQDPQYVLTDLYSKEDLNKIGDKLKVSKDLPDRDNFIKQRAQKTALQGNTLWMMTAGLATPLISALACNRLEQPVNNLMENATLISTEKALKTNKQGFFGRIKQKLSDMSFERFLKKHADDVLDDKMIAKLTDKIAREGNSTEFADLVRSNLSAMKPTFKWDMETLKSVLKSSNVDENLVAKLGNLDPKHAEALTRALSKGSVKGIASSLTIISGAKPVDGKKLSNSLMKVLTDAQRKGAASSSTTVGAISENVRTLRTGFGKFVNAKQILDKFTIARVGEKSNTYIANQWDRVCNTFIKGLKLNSSELEAVTRGNTDVIVAKLEEIAKPGNEKQFNKLVTKLMKLIGDFDEKTGAEFMQKVGDAAKKMSADASDTMKGSLDDIAKTTVKIAKESSAGSKSSYYRLVQVLDLFKKSNDSNFAQQVGNLLKKHSPDIPDEEVAGAAQKLIQKAKKLLLSGNATDYSEKLTTANFKLSTAEYKTLMQLLFDSEADTTIAKSLSKTMSSDRSGKLLGGLKKYKKEFMNKVVNWKNGMTPELSRYVLIDPSKASDKISSAAERANLIGNPTIDAFKSSATKMYNSNKWLKIFGGAFIALTAVTLVAGLAIGRKGETEKQVEAEAKSKLNG